MAGPELDGDGSELVPPLFTKATFNALGQFEHLRTLVCPIWEKDGRWGTIMRSRCSLLLVSIAHRCGGTLEGETFQLF